MAGYICKIVMEDTHPPVWRRVLIPDKITFGELHNIIQVLFGWADAHLHEFQIPADSITISDDEEDAWGCHYHERETLIDSFFRNYKWIRYVYDFGDDWRHRINIEQTDEDYKARSAVLMKFKGDNFEEDSGGIWGMDGDARRAFNLNYVEKRLKRMVLPKHEELQETPLLKETMEHFGNLVREFLALKPEVLQSKLAQLAEDFYDEASPMKQKIDMWRAFEEEAWSFLKFASTEKSQKELLLDLGEKEAADYYKYLRIPRTGILSREELVSAVSDTLREHPEYLFYIFDEKEYQALTEWILCASQGKMPAKSKHINLPIKALELGLADFTRTSDGGELCFASDIAQFIGVVDVKTKKKTYKGLAEFDNRLGKMIQVYGMIELESLYEIYKKLYEVSLDKEVFLRYIYWHSRFNNFVNTVYKLDGTCYVAAKELDVQRVMEKTEDYAKELAYAVYSRQEMEHKGADLANRSAWVDSYFVMLRYTLGLEAYEAEDWLINTIVQIINGCSLNWVIGILEEQNWKNWSLEAAVEGWKIISGMMLELELPMLKGRCRIQYAEEQKCSPWSIGMIEEQNDISNTRNCHMYQFSGEIQEWMYEAAGFGSEDSIRLLWDYKEQYHICSEEYLYLLAEACITFGHTKEAEKLIKQLESSSTAGKKAAKHLDERLMERYDVMDDEDDWSEDGWSWMEQETVQQPYVRAVPKIGRNEPCPCGSGKKYKKCCGK